MKKNIKCYAKIFNITDNLFVAQTATNVFVYSDNKTIRIIRELMLDFCVNML